MLERGAFLARLAAHGGVAVAIVALGLAIGTVGYRLTEQMAWIDAFLNASMILGGMGPVDRLSTEAGKLFASLYALFAGIVFVAVAGLLLAPLIHRLLHGLDVDIEDGDAP